MNIRRIGPELERELLTRSLRGESTRDLAAWLSEEKGIAGCSHMTVARRLVGLKLAESVPANLTATEVSRAINGLVATFRNLDEEFEEIAAAARLPADDPQRGDLTTLRLAATRRQQAALTLFRYLTERQRTLEQRRIDEEMAREDPHDAEMWEKHERQMEELHRAVMAPLPPRKPVPAAKATATPPITKAVAAPAPRTLATPPITNPQPAATPSASPERNKPCPCGSGMKFKKCCGGPNPRTVTATVTAAPSGA